MGSFRNDEGNEKKTNVVKVGTHQGACSRSTLLQHAPGAKLPRLHQRFLAKKYVAQQNFCSLIWYEVASSRGKSVHESVSGASSLVCTEICMPWHDVSPVGQSNWFIFSSTTHYELTFKVPMPQSGRFIIQLPRRVLRVYWLGYLPGSVFQEQAPSCVPPLIHLNTFPLLCFGYDGKLPSRRVESDL